MVVFRLGAPLKLQHLRELALLFLRLGATTFGGPAAHIAVMEDEIVRRRSWLDRQEFLDLLGATHLIPGPNSTEMAIHIGYRRAGLAGLVVAGLSFILPAALLSLALAWGYARYRTIPAVETVLYGVKPVIIAVVVQAIWGLARTGIPTRRLLLVAILALVANALGMNELLVLFAAGLLSVAASGTSRARALALPLLLLPSGATAVGTGAIFLFFLKVGSILYGSGYVLLAFLRSDLVVRHRWLTEAELLDAVAVGQITPGPVFSVATFIGYLLDGFPGAVAATVGIFLPAFLFVAVSGPLVARIRRSPALSAFLDGVIAASLSLMAVVAFELAKGSLVDLGSLAILLASAVALMWFRVSSSWLILAGGLVSVLARSFG
jgi:chromate transporter